MEIDIDRVAVSLEALDMVPALVARRLGVLPLTVVDDVIYLAMEDPEDFAAIDQVESITGFPAKGFSVSLDSDLPAAIREYYPTIVTESDHELESAEQVLNELLSRALKMRASDIHVFPEEEGASLFFRIDSTLVKGKAMSGQAAAELISYIKVKAGLNIAEKRLPLDGNISLKRNGGDANLRVGTIPTIHGEHLTLRLLSNEVFHDLSQLDTLGFDDGQLQQVRSAMHKAQGLIYLSGPTGSGKTTTMYSILKELMHPVGKHIVSVEDPVECIIPGLTQIPVNTDEDPMKFHKVLRSVLRHDPDIIFIGETRDAESAQVAQHAAMTGHLVFSTVHANDSVSVIERLLELKVDRSLLAGCITQSIAQRLLRRPCPYCLQVNAAGAEEFAALGLEPSPQFRITSAPGCPLCRGNGNAGRIGIFEILNVGEPEAAVIAESSGYSHELKQKIRPERTLLQDGIMKMQQDLTLYEDVLGLIRT